MIWIVSGAGQVVQSYMGFIMQAAEAAVADMLVDFSKRQELAPVRTANLASLMYFVSFRLPY